MAKIIPFERRPKKPKKEAPTLNPQEPQVSERTQAAFQNFISELMSDPAAMQAGGFSSMVAPVEIMESKDKIIVRIPLQGFTREEIRLTASRGVLHVRLFKLENASKTIIDPSKSLPKDFQAEVTQSIPIPLPVEEKLATADLNEGILSVSFPRRVELSGENTEIPIS